MTAVGTKVDEGCPSCGHGWKVHTKQHGCYWGWPEMWRGTVVANAKVVRGSGNGCRCPVAHPLLSPDDDSGELFVSDDRQGGEQQ